MNDVDIKFDEIIRYDGDDDDDALKVVCPICDKTLLDCGYNKEPSKMETCDHLIAWYENITPSFAHLAPYLDEMFEKINDFSEGECDVEGSCGHSTEEIERLCECNDFDSFQFIFGDMSKSSDVIIQKYVASTLVGGIYLIDIVAFKKNPLTLEEFEEIINAV